MIGVSYMDAGFGIRKEKTQKTLIDEEMENSNNLVNRQNECIKNIAKYGRELLNILKEMNELEVNKRVEDYSFARQVLLHSIENGKEPSNVLSKLQNISKVRRNYISKGEKPTPLGVGWIA